MQLSQMSHVYALDTIKISCREFIAYANIEFFLHKIGIFIIARINFTQFVERKYLCFIHYFRCLRTWNDEFHLSSFSYILEVMFPGIFILTHPRNNIYKYKLGSRWESEMKYVIMKNVYFSYVSPKFFNFFSEVSII